MADKPGEPIIHQCLKLFGEKVKRPVNYDLWIEAAGLYLLGNSWEKAAEQIGRDARTIYRWRIDERWPLAMAEAETKWDDKVLGSARNTIETAIRGGDAKTACWYMERRAKGYAPPSQRHELTGANGGPIKHNFQIEIVDPTEEKENADSKSVQAYTDAIEI